MNAAKWLRPAKLLAQAVQDCTPTGFAPRFTWRPTKYGKYEATIDKSKIKIKVFWIESVVLTVGGHDIDRDDGNIYTVSAVVIVDEIGNSAGPTKPSIQMKDGSDFDVDLRRNGVTTEWVSVCVNWWNKAVRPNNFRLSGRRNLNWLRDGMVEVEIGRGRGKKRSVVLLDLFLGVVVAGIASGGGPAPNGARILFALGRLARWSEVERREVESEDFETSLRPRMAEVAPEADGGVEGFKTGEAMAVVCEVLVAKRSPSMSCGFVDDTLPLSVERFPTNIACKHEAGTSRNTRWRETTRKGRSSNFVTTPVNLLERGICVGGDMKVTTKCFVNSGNDALPSLRRSTDE